MNQKFSYYQLHAKVDAMSKFLDLDSYIRGDKNSLDQIRSYYKINDWAYKFFHSHDGFMHFRVSKNGCFTDEDGFYQPDVVSSHIKDGDRVLELGFGMGPNIMYLARCHPDVRFFGVDLQELKERNVPENITTYKHDYSDLSQFEDNSIDVAYAFETIVHNTDKEKIFKEVCRVLKPNGVFIVYDYALSADFDSFDEHVQKAVALISKGGASAMIESLVDMNAHFTNSGLEIEHRANLAENILPDLKALERKASKVLTRPFLSKMMFTLLPTQFVTNIILGYLGYDSMKSGVLTYQEWVLRKPTTA